MCFSPALSQKQITSQVLRKMRRELPVEMIEIILSFVDYSVKFLEPTSLLYKMIIPRNIDGGETFTDKFRALKRTSKEYGISIPAWKQFWRHTLDYDVIAYNSFNITKYGRYLNNDVPLHFADLKVGQTFNTQVKSALGGALLYQYSYVVVKKNKKSFKIDKFSYEWRKQKKYTMERHPYGSHTIKLCDVDGRTDLGFKARDDNGRPWKMPFIEWNDDKVKYSLCGFLCRNLWEYEPNECRDAVMNDNWELLMKFYELAIKEEDEPDRYNRTPVALIKFKKTLKMGDEEMTPETRCGMVVKEKDVELHYDEDEEEEIFNSVGKGLW